MANKVWVIRGHHYDPTDQELDQYKLERARYEFINDGKYKVRYFCNNCRTYFYRRFNRGEYAASEFIECNNCGTNNTVKTLEQ